MTMNNISTSSDLTMISMKHLSMDSEQKVITNGGKTKAIILRNRFQQMNKKITFRVRRENINLTSSLKCLGVHLA